MVCGENLAEVCRCRSSRLKRSQAIRHIISPANPGSASTPSSNVTCMKLFLRLMSRRHPDLIPKPAQVALLDAEECYLFLKINPSTLQRKLTDECICVLLLCASVPTALDHIWVWKHGNWWMNSLLLTFSPANRPEHEIDMWTQSRRPNW